MASSRQPPQTSVFIDASVLFAATLSERGRAHDLVLAGARDEVVLVVSAFVVFETRRNLAKKAPRALPDIDALLALAPVLTVDPPPSLVRRVAAEIALKDAPIVAGALHASARFLATYDRKHLLSHAVSIDAKFGIVVSTPNEILVTIERSS